MHKQIYVNLAVNDLARSTAFFGELGFSFDATCTNEQAACMVVGENIYTVLLVKDFFKTVTHKTPSDPLHGTEALVCLSCDSRAEVDTLVAKAIAAGGTAARAPQDYGFMYQHGFEDPDGHAWGLIHLDPSAAAAN
jgi:predicted lactoylglutathione lyase